jgi:hypothetical protein
VHARVHVRVHCVDGLLWTKAHLVPDHFFMFPRQWIRFLVYDSYYAYMIPIMWKGYSDSRMPLH